ncbi:flagellar hook-associated protein 2 [Piscibacillus halophilus]|uniref:flagellar hook-associated protein 2 n=1 Tax=Piscibacillus halophilus TaxID=571933 RepID=UPI001FE4D84F|nr:flagellar hook-associated protein 2 [Piscibacillus halophilus]
MINNNMRMTGFASGMDINQMVKDLMQAERLPLQKMEQDQLWLTQRRDAYREVNTKLSEFENKFFDMRLSKTYLSKIASSSSDAISVSASNQASDGNYSFQVDQLASAATRYSGVEGTTFGKGYDADQALAAEYVGQEVSFAYHDQSQDSPKTVSFTIQEGDSLNDVLKNISDESGGAVRAFYDQNSDRVFMERTETGDFNKNGLEFEQLSAFFTDTLNIAAEEQGGTDAEFKYNGIAMTSHSNNYQFNGMNLTFNSATDGPVNVSVSQDVDGAVDKITEFVEQYNELIDFMNEKVGEERYRDYPPLTEAQRKEMSEREIELWEERSKSGELRNDGILRSALSGMRSAWYESVDNLNGDLSRMMDVGITTTSDWRQGGKLEVDEQKLREKLEEDPNAVYRLFSNSDEGDSRGILNRVEGVLESTMDRIKDRAGSTAQTDFQYTMGRELKSMAERMANFERRMQQTEQRYWDQFTAMEKAMQRYNQQANYMMQQFGGMQ